jgi:hypothetical protein
MLKGKRTGRAGRLAAIRKVAPMLTAAQFRNLGLAGNGGDVAARLTTTIITITTTRKRGGSG